MVIGSGRRELYFLTTKGKVETKKIRRVFTRLEREIKAVQKLRENEGLIDIMSLFNSL
jgi:DNA-binding MarR family transcriptional regulator